MTVRGVQARMAVSPQSPVWQWETRDASVDISSDVEVGRVSYRFELDGRFPIQRADVIVPGNHLAEWTLESRADADAPWQWRAGPWVAYGVVEAGTRQQSAAQALGSIVRDREWRLTAAKGAPAPQLRLGYLPETLVFVASGQPPYRVLAGSAQSARAEAPLAALLAALRAQRGAQWQPAIATMGAAQATAIGAQALVVKPPPRDRKTWLLWGMLVAGAGVVAFFALSLLRGKS